MTARLDVDTPCQRCHTDAGPMVEAADDKTYCTECVVPCTICGEHVPVDDAAECAGSSIPRPDFHCPDCWERCGACASDAAREQAEEFRADAQAGY